MNKLIRWSLALILMAGSGGVVFTCLSPLRYASSSNVNGIRGHRTSTYAPEALAIRSGSPGPYTSVSKGIRSYSSSAELVFQMNNISGEQKAVGDDQESLTSQKVRNAKIKTVQFRGIMIVHDNKRGLEDLSTGQAAGSEIDKDSWYVSSKMSAEPIDDVNETSANKNEMTSWRNVLDPFELTGNDDSELMAIQRPSTMLHKESWLDIRPDEEDDDYRGNTFSSKLKVISADLLRTE